MAIPRRISFLEESRSRGMIDLHSSGFEEYEIYSSGSSGNFEESVIQKSWKSPQNFKKNVKKKSKKKISIEFILQSPKYSVIIPKIDRVSWKTEWKTEKSRQIAENCPIFTISRSSANFGEDSRSRGVIKSIPRGIEEWTLRSVHSSIPQGIDFITKPSRTILLENSNLWLASDHYLPISKTYLSLCMIILFSYKAAWIFKSALM